MRRLLIPLLLVAAAAIPATQVATCAAQEKKLPDKVLADIEKALPDKAPAKPKQARNLLIFTRTAGFRHGSIPVGVRAITMMGDKTGAFTAHHTEDESIFEPGKLAKFDAVLMLNTTGECFKPKTGTPAEIKAREELLKKSLTDFVASGKGLAGFHSATDTYQNWKAYNKMMGGAFVSHPWHKKVPITNLDPKNPVNAAFGGDGFEVTDEIYMFRNDTAQVSERRMLLALDTSKMNPKDVAAGKRTDGVYAISWLAKYGKGRNFYCSLGHRDEIYWNPVVLKHYLAGLQFALGDLEADATPLPVSKDK